jgi:hypothetical protein
MLCSQPGAWSQLTRVSQVAVGGRVTAKGQPLAEATVTVTNPISGARITAMTDASDTWSLPGLRRGVYLIRIEKDGYSPFTRQQSVPSADQEFDCSAAYVLNAVQYSAVNTQFDSPTVGQVTATQPMRQLTFLGRFRF